MKHYSQKKKKKELFFFFGQNTHGTKSRAQTLVPLLLAMVAWLDFNSNPINLFSSIDIDLQSSKASLIWSNLNRVGFLSTPNSWTVLISWVGFPSTPNSLALSKEMDTFGGLIIGIYKSFYEWFSSSSQVFYNLFHSYNLNFLLYLCLK